jgi:Domain of Unknown Function (DUF1080)
MWKRTRLFVAGLLAAVALAPAAAEADNGDKELMSLFNGTDLTGWKLRGDPEMAKAKSKWVVGRCEVDTKNASKFNVTPIPPQADGGPAARWLINASAGVDLISEKKFGDCTVEVEFMIPKGSNSGIYLMGEYEVQVLDSYGKEKLDTHDMGAIYTIAVPKVNASKKPGEWQKIVIDFQAPRFDKDNKVANAKVLKVVFNDQVIHENVDVTGATGGALGKEVAEGPLMIQGDHGPIAIRSIKVTAKN